MDLGILAWGDTGWGDELARGVLTTVAIATAAYLVGTLLGIFLATMKLSGSAALNVPATQTRLVIMASAGGEGGRIGLVEFSAPSPADNRRDPERTGRGDPVLVFDVTDAEAIHARLRDAGARILEPPQVYVSKKLAADGTPMRGRVFHVRDPDGYLVELLEAPKPAR